MNTTPLLSRSPLARALNLRVVSGAPNGGPPLTVAFTGSGGKTTCAEELARDAAAAGLRVVLTTTTKMRVPPVFLDPRDADAVRAALATGTSPLIVGHHSDEPHRMTGPSREILADLAENRGVDLLVVEADGSREASVKAYRDHEPVPPPRATHTVVLVGVDAVGADFSSPRVHRSALLWPLLNLSPDAQLTPADVARAIFTQRAYLHAGGESLLSILINKIDSEEDAETAAALQDAMAGYLHTSPVASLLWRGTAVCGPPGRDRADVVIRWQSAKRPAQPDGEVNPGS